MGTTTHIKEAINAEGVPIKLEVAYDDKVHNTPKYAAYLPVYDIATNLHRPKSLSLKSIAMQIPVKPIFSL
jgi:hypothetical protein